MDWDKFEGSAMGWAAIWNREMFCDIERKWRDAIRADAPLCARKYDEMMEDIETMWIAYSRLIARITGHNIFFKRYSSGAWELVLGNGTVVYRNKSKTEV